MSTKLDHIVVIDIEATCWRGEPPTGQQKEIIEVGVCLLNVDTGLRSRRRGLLVKPTRSTVSDFCTKLTTLTQTMLDEKGIPFADACDLLQKQYKSRQRVWASYGNYDRQHFMEQCQLEGVVYPFNESHINIKNLFALMHKLPREVGMVEALKLLGMPLEGTHHRGKDDAWNSAGILAALLRR